MEDKRKIAKEKAEKEVKIAEQVIKDKKKRRNFSHDQKPNTKKVVKKRKGDSERESESESEEDPTEEAFTEEALEMENGKKVVIKGPKTKKQIVKKRTARTAA